MPTGVKQNGGIDCALGYVGLPLLHSLSGLCGFYMFRIFENQSNRCDGTVATFWLLDCQSMAGEWAVRLWRFWLVGSV